MCKDIFIFFNKVYIISKKDKKGHYHSCMSKKGSAKRSNPIAKTAPSQMLSASATSMLSLSKGEAFAKISSVVALQARSDKRKSESLGGKSMLSPPKQI